jgi:SAM-dependent methyltransferase
VNLLSFADIKQSSADIIAMLEQTDVTILYRDMLKIQFEIDLASTVQFYFNHPRWNQAQHILDIGCGPGDHIFHISKYYPDKFYTGIDINEAFIDIAKELNQSSKNCYFECSDLYSYQNGTFDFIVLRAVLQHVQEPERFINNLRLLMNDHALVLINDTDNQNFISSQPPIPAFIDFYQQLERVQREKGGGNRNCLFDLEQRLDKYGFKLVDAFSKHVPLISETEKINIMNYMILICATVTKILPINLRFQDLFDQIIDWYESEAPYSQFNTKMMTIERLSSCA